MFGDDPQRDGTFLHDEKGGKEKKKRGWRQGSSFGRRSPSNDTPGDPAWIETALHWV